MTPTPTDAPDPASPPLVAPTHPEEPVTQPDKIAERREQVQALIHARLLKLHEDAECACPMCAAEALVELFPIVGSERLMVVDDVPYVLPGEVPATHRRYVLRTAPEPIRAEGPA